MLSNENKGLLLANSNIENNKNTAIELLKKAKVIYDENIGNEIESYSQGNKLLIEQSLGKIIELEEELQSIQREILLISNKSILSKLQSKVDAIIKKQTIGTKDDGIEMEAAQNELIRSLKDELANVKQQLKELEIFKDNFSLETLRNEKQKKEIFEVCKQSTSVNSFVNGFLREFSKAFISAQAVDGGLLKIEGEYGDVISLISTSVSFIPLIGSFLEKITSFGGELISLAIVKNSCANLSLLCINPIKADEIALSILTLAVDNPILIENYRKSNKSSIFKNLIKLRDSVYELKETLEDYIQNITQETYPIMKNLVRKWHK